MKLRLPLYARILGLFLLNVLVLAAAFVGMFRMQFHLGLDSVLAGRANQRVRALSDVVIRELQDLPTEGTDAVLDRFSKSFGLNLYVFRANGDQLAGPRIVLPPEVNRLIRRRGLGRGGFAGGDSGLPRGPRFGQTLPGDPGTGTQPPPSDGLVNPEEEPLPELLPQPPLRRGDPEAGRGPGRRWLEASDPAVMPPTFFIKSAPPTRYWAGSFFVPGPPGGVGPPHVLLMESDSVTGGGLFFDLTPWAVAGFGGLVLSGLLWLPFVRGITRALARMSRTTADISVGQFEARVATRRRDELGQLAESINEMAGRLEGFVKGQRRFLGDIAHELCSPLARIQTALGILEQRAQPKDQAYVRDLQEEAEHMSQLIDELLSFSRASMDRSKTVLGPVHLVEVAANAVRREQTPGVEIRQNIAADLVAQANGDLLQRAVANLLRNAIRHAGPSGPITVHGWREGGEILVEVADRGPGVPEESLANLFDPFYRVDASRTRETGGVGLGLTIVKTCVEACGGAVRAANRPEGGLSVRIRLNSSPP